MAGEEEMEAMATQFSELPEHIIHRILSFLPSIKDVVRTSAISKSCLQAWLTFPILHFDFGMKDFVPRFSREAVEAETQQQFIRFVNTTMQRFENRMKIFNLSNVNEQMAHHITRWIGMALDNKVEHLALNMYPKSDGSVKLPGRVLSAYWLKSLKLIGPVDLPKSLTEGYRVDLPELTSLHIESSYISDEQLRKLLTGCPALEYICLNQCGALSKVDIFNHPNLETLIVSTSRIKTIRVRAPKLKSLDCTCDCTDDVKIYNSPELKSLTIGDQFMTDEWFNTFIAQFPLMEDLKIDMCDELRKIRISNPLLEKIRITHCFDLKDVVISSKKLTSFYLFTSPSSIKQLSIPLEIDNPPNDCIVRLFDDPLGDDLMKASWYCELKDFLSGPFVFKSLDIDVAVATSSVVDGDMMGEDVQKKLPTACSIEKLKLKINAPSSCHSHILNGFLSACHPTTIELDVKKGNSFVKLVFLELYYVKLAFVKLESIVNKCWCKDDFKCWMHQLKDVKIEKIEGIKLEKEDLKWDAVYDLLPTLEDGNNIYFKLMW